LSQVCWFLSQLVVIIMILMSTFLLFLSLTCFFVSKLHEPNTPIVSATQVMTTPQSAPTVAATTTTVVPPKTAVVMGPPAGGLGRFVVLTYIMILLSDHNWLLTVLYRESCATTCPNCKAQVRTRVTHQADTITLVAVIALILLFFPLFWLPLCLPSCKSTEHYCSACNFRISKQEACS
jgi:hypothetical protein